MDKNKLYQRLRDEFPYMVFEDFSMEENAGGIKIRYHFNLASRFSFFPELFIPVKDFYKINFQSKHLQNLAFHIGMVELISYWKAACSPLVIIKPAKLFLEQVEWWKKLWFKGLGEFFHTNRIAADYTDFLQIKAEGTGHFQPFSFEHDKAVIVPLGGGKDSVVTLEMMKKNHRKVIPFILNQRGASLQTAKTAGFSEDGIITAFRTIHPKLLELNKQGFLNGHTPFSALLAFVSLLPAMISGTQHIALSNESSANEATVASTGVNHQYSKSFEFEKDFREYVAKYLSPDFNYFSFLRPVNELQIGKLFSEHPQYFEVFKSCNAGSKTDSWCGECPKCLFTWIILSPFLSQQILISIFGKNLLENESLINYLDELSGIAPEKPFECVGTVDEVNSVLHHLSEKMKRQDLPVLLKHYLALSELRKPVFLPLTDLLKQFEKQHFLLPEFETLLRDALQ